MNWRSDAACRGKNWRLWFPLAAGQAYQRRAGGGDLYAVARSICTGCPARQACLAEALTAERRGIPTHGMWGGLDEVERRALLRNTKRPRVQPNCGTPSGYKQHRRLGEPACVPCLEANRRKSGDERAATRQERAS